MERNDLIYKSEILPQSNQLNPAFYPQTRNAYITLPNFNFSIGLPVAYSDLGISRDKEKDKTILNIYQISSALDENKSVHLETKVNLIGFGFHAGHLFFNFNASAVVGASLYFPSGLKSLFDEGLVTRIGQNNAFDFSCSEFLNLMAYERFSLGMGYEVNDQLTLGAHVNLLNGIANINVENFSTKLWYSDNAFSNIHGTLNYSVLRGGMIDYDMERDEVSFSHSFGNMGVTFDLGAMYEVNNFRFSASIIDLGGGIHWTENTNVIHPKRSNVDYNGIDIDNMISGGNMDLDFFDGISDSIADIIDYTDNDTSNFYYNVPTKIYLGAGYRINQLLRADLLFHGEWDKGLFTTGSGSDIGNGHFRYNASLSLSLNLNKGLELMVANAMAFDGEKGSLFNPGVGLTLSPGNTVQLFFMADYISSFYAVDIKATTLQFGMNVCFGGEREKKLRQKEDNSPIIEFETMPATESDTSSEPMEAPAKASSLPYINNETTPATIKNTLEPVAAPAPAPASDPTNANKSATPIVF
ncbi:MAG: hypothetical protein IJ844_09265 [Prevotella sp.]|nr:hypothetical protein [Prevotella sp.]